MRSYVSPAVLDGFARGRVLGCCLEPGEVLGLHARRGLHDVERALVAYLREAPGTRATPLLTVGGGRGMGVARSARLGGPGAKPLPRAARVEG